MQLHVRLSLVGQIIVLLMLAGVARAQGSFDFASHPFFKEIIGEWTTEGDIRFEDGHVVHNKQDWKAEVTGANVCTINGTREWAGQTIHYKWTITHLDSGIFEHVFQPDMANAATERYDAKVAEDNSQVELTGRVENNAKVIITEGFKGADRNTMEVTVKLFDGEGTLIYAGAATAKKHKQAK
jgi:hypothetical protein